MVERVFRRVSACALPRPSATDSARLAKTTVSQSQTAMAMVNADGSTTAAAVVSAAPTSTMNMTGFRHMSRGSSFRRAPGRPATS